MDKRVVRVYILSILLTLAVGALSGFLSDMSGYGQAIKPALTPPNWVFPVVWNILYIMMGISLARIVLSDSTNKKPAIYLYLLQLLMNFSWSLIFFNLQAYSFAFIWLCLLIIVVVFTIIKFGKIDKIAGYLLIPYLLWLLFACYLSYSVMQLNL